MAGLERSFGSTAAYKKHAKDTWDDRLPNFVRSLGHDPEVMTLEEMKSLWGHHFGDLIKNKTLDERTAVLEKRFATNVALYGSKGTLGNDIVQDRYKKTNRTRRGVDYVLQDPKIFAKAENARHRRKTFVFPSGAIIKVQGYEPWALEDLLKQGILESDFIIGGGKISLEYSDGKGMMRKFYPDIYIPSQHRLIEVKSTYTYNLHLALNILKHKEAIAQGYSCEFWVYDGKRNLRIIDQPPSGLH